MSGLSGFLRLGLADARERLTRITAFEPPDDAELAAVVEASAVVRLVARVVNTVRNAANHSAFANRACAVRGAWLRQLPAQRTRETGAALVTAASAHLALVFWQGRPPGWLWLVVPALAIAFGLLMALAPSRGLRDEVRP